MLNLKIIIASTRPGRKGLAIGNWFHEIALKHPAFNTEVLDLAVINLPFMDEPGHPMMQKYQHQHTKDWAAIINSADAFVIVTPEYNYGFPAPLKNALDFLYKEWNYKPVGCVGYGGVSGGTRAVQMLKLVLTAQKMMPLPEAVNIPFFFKYMDEQGKFNGDEALAKSANDMLNEMNRWAVALKTMRSTTPQ
jgi:NAD(P)H-dependent FMN reductase